MEEHLLSINHLAYLLNNQDVSLKWSRKGFAHEYNAKQNMYMHFVSELINTLSGAEISSFIYIPTMFFQ